LRRLGFAADELARSTGIEAIAIARFRHELRAGLRPRPDANTLIVVDEAGMVGVRDMSAIFEAAIIGTTAGEAGRSSKFSSPAIAYNLLRCPAAARSKLCPI
jgi:hypothetical protein